MPGWRDFLYVRLPTIPDANKNVAIVAKVLGRTECSVTSRLVILKRQGKVRSNHLPAHSISMAASFSAVLNT